MFHSKSIQYPNAKLKSIKNLKLLSHCKSVSKKVVDTWHRRTKTSDLHKNQSVASIKFNLFFIKKKNEYDKIYDIQNIPC